MNDFLLRNLHLVRGFPSQEDIRRWPHSSWRMVGFGCQAGLAAPQVFAHGLAAVWKMIMVFFAHRTVRLNEGKCQCNGVLTLDDIGFSVRKEKDAVNKSRRAIV